MKENKNKEVKLPFKETKNIVANDRLWNISRRVLTLGIKKNFSQIEVITDTIDNSQKTKNVKNIEVLPISNLMGEAIKRISNSTSVSDLFK